MADYDVNAAERGIVFIDEIVRLPVRAITLDHPRRERRRGATGSVETAGGIGD